MPHELAKKDYPRTAVYNVSVEIPPRAMPGESTATANPKPPPPDRPGRHQNLAIAPFAVAPGCSPSLQHTVRYVKPINVFMGDKDDANNPEWCQELTKKKRSVPVQMIEYQGANHDFPVNAPAHDFMGWHLSYNPTAEKDMMQTIISAIRTKKFAKGIENR
jgi:dienelactone hydrolase